MFSSNISETSPKKVISFCPKCGCSEFVFQENNSFLCKSCKFNLFINAASAVAVLIFNKQGELLLTRRAVDPFKGMLDLPGGFVDVGETAEQAVVREIFEELNLNVLTIKYLLSSPNEYVFGGLSVYTLDLAFECCVNSFSDIKTQDDVDGYEFHSINNIPFERIGAFSIKQIIYNYIKNARKKNM